MKEYKVKISDELLSAVFGCECEFVMILKNDVVFRCENDICNENVFYDEFHQCNLINLDTFIRLGKIWAFDNGYNVVEHGKQCCVSCSGEYLKDCNKNPNGKESYLRVDVLEALEWVAN